jgi:hypothetical protein
MATQDPTVNYSWDLPTVGGSSGAWGTALNVIFGDDATGIDAIVKAVSDVADAALSRAGGTMTGEIVTLTQTFTASDLGNMTGATPLDLDAANAFYGTATGTITFSFSNVPATGQFVFVVLEITNGGSQTINWPASVDFPGGSPPALTVSGKDTLTLYTRDGGVTWNLAPSMIDLS